MRHIKLFYHQIFCLCIRTWRSQQLTWEKCSCGRPVRSSRVRPPCVGSGPDNPFRRCRQSNRDLGNVAAGGWVSVPRRSAASHSASRVRSRTAVSSRPHLRSIERRPRIPLPQSITKAQPSKVKATPIISRTNLICLLVVQFISLARDSSLSFILSDPLF